MSTTSTPTDLDTRAAAVIGGGATHAARSYRPSIRVVRARGSRKWLVDGREIVDYTMGHGALLLGHAHPAVVAAVRAQVADGTHYGAPSVCEIEWAERIAALVDSVEQVHFTASGTEAVMLSLRIARVATGRETVVKFHEHFHGWSDAVSVDLDPAGHAAGTPGVPAAVAELTRVVRPGDGAGLAAALGDRRAAALIVEASGAHYGRSPLIPGELALARDLCDATGTLLVVDEVVTGFRVAPGGIQEELGVRPDLSVFGKIMAGGLPGGAVGGRPDLLGLLSPGAGHVAHPGTYNANPLTAAAGIATLDLVSDGSAQAAASRYASALEEAWTAALRDAGVAGSVWRLASIVHTVLDDPGAQDRLGSALRAEGVDLLHTSAFCSTAHGDEDLDRTVSAYERAIRAASGTAA